MSTAKMNIGDTKVDIPTSSPPPYVEQPQSRSTAKRVTRVILALVSLYVLLNIISWSSPFSGRPSTARKHRIHWPRPRLPTMSPAEAESHLLQSISAENIREYSRSYTSFAHVAGTEGDLRSAKLAEQRWANLLGVHSHGILESGTHESQNAIRSIGHLHRPTVHVDTYHSLLNYPLGNSSLSMFDSQGKQVYRANLTEPPVKGDETSQHGMQDVPLFHGFSKAGSAKGQLVYANMGRMQDYQRLKDNGIDLNGKIAIVRYGGSFRGLKVSAGESFGIAGVLIYSDPAEDGEITEANGYKPYPEGPARHPLSVQRGSVQKLSSYPGDPLTPGQPSYKNASRLPRDTPDLSLVGIPSLPLSYHDALPLLRTLSGKGEKIDEWQGGLTEHGVEYFTGPSDESLVLNNQIEEKINPLWNVYASIPGLIQDEVVIIGNHRDAWTYGAGDPNSGSSALDEIVRVFGEMLSKGWKPLRPILIASWDGEEYGLLGSTEFGEDFATWLKQKAAIYINVDVAAAGSIYDLAASPALISLYQNITSYVQAPDEPHKKLSDYIKGDRAIRPLGSGSDYTVFLQHLGISASDMSFRKGKKDPVYHYHSIYDSEFWMEKYGDPTFSRHAAASKVLGLAVLRTADSVILPFSMSDYAAELKHYATEVREDAADASPKHGDFAVLDFDQLDAAVEKIGVAAQALEEEAKTLLSSICPHANPIKKYFKIRSINQRLSKFERKFIDETGLPQRNWYKHLAVAPGRLAGYGSSTFPGLKEAITLDRDAHSAATEMYKLLRALARAESHLRG